MITALANHLWQSTAVALIAALLARALRSNHARARYWLWMAASLKFLLPFSLLMAIGGQWHWRASAPIATPEVSAVMEQITQPFPEAHSLSRSVPATVAPAHSVIPSLAAALWICGFAVVIFSWWRRWKRAHAAVRSAMPVATEAGVPVLVSEALLEPGVFGIFRPVLILPRGIMERLGAPHLRAVIAHELCHVRRRDNLAAALHMAVEAAFWFHPLVWWIGSRLVEERERACDEEVLRLGSAPEVYAESILRTCQFCVESPLACVSGITGADLKNRIVRIMAARTASELSIIRKLLLAATAGVIIAVPLFFGTVSRAQSEPAAGRGKPTFEVASIKPNHSGEKGMGIRPSPGRFRAENIVPRVLIEFAYNLKPTQLSGGPEWINSEHYDIEAKIDDAEAERMDKMSSEDSAEQMRLMMQSLLADRFGLKLSSATKELPIYALVVGKNGPKLKESKGLPMPPDGPGGPGMPPPPPPPADANAKPMGRGPRFGKGMIMFRPGHLMVNGPVESLADVLSRQVGREVVDKTGIEGNYEMELNWTPDASEARFFPGGGPGPGGPGGRPDGPPPPDPNGPDLFTAIQEQLGLKLESTRGPVETFTIQQVERPSAN